MTAANGGSFTYIDAVEGIIRLTKSARAEPVNLGSDAMVSMNQMQEMALKFAGKPNMPIKHIPGPSRGSVGATAITAPHQGKARGAPRSSRGRSEGDFRLDFVEDR